MSDDNLISAEITPENRALFLQKLDEALALLPALPELTDKQLKRLLGIDESTELDTVAAESLAAHPEWKPFVVSATEYPKDRALFSDTEAMETKSGIVARKVIVMRRLAANDTRRATLAIYNQLAELAARGNVEAKAYYDRMSPHFPGRPPKTTAPTA